MPIYNLLLNPLNDFQDINKHKTHTQPHILNTTNVRVRTCLISGV